MAYADEQENTVAAISGMADVLDEAAEVVTTGISSQNVTSVSYTHLTLPTTPYV